MVANSNYRKGEPVGVPLDSEQADNADIQNPWDHVQKKEKNETSHYTSFSEERVHTEIFSKSTKIKTKKSDLKGLADAGVIRIHTPEDVRQMMADAGMKKKNIQGVITDMRKNKEVLIEGIIPADFIKSC